MPQKGRRGYRGYGYSKRHRYARPMIRRRKKYSKYQKGSKGIARSGLVVFPQAMYKCLQYQTGPLKLQQVSTTVPQNYLMAGNGLYDCDLQLGGHQPRYFDTLCGAPDNSSNGPYSRYQVNASKITITIWQDPTLTGTSGSVDGIVSVIPVRGDGSTNLPQTVVQQLECTNLRWKSVGNANSSRPLVLKHFAKTKSLYNLANLSANPDFSGSYNSNPATNNAWTWAMQINNVNSGTGVNLFSCWYNIKVKYYVKFWNLNNVLTS